MNRNHFLKTTVAVALMALFTVSCSKDNDAPALNLQQETAAIPCGYQDEVLGRVGNPMNPASFGEVAVTLGTSSFTQDSLTVPSTAQIKFVEHANASVIHANTAVLKKFVTNKAVCSLTKADWTASGTTVVTTPQGNGDWYEYDPISHEAEPIDDVVMLVSNDNGVNVWAFTFESVDAWDNNLTPPFLRIRNNTTINVYKLP